MIYMDAISRVVGSQGTINRMSQQVSSDEIYSTIPIEYSNLNTTLSLETWIFDSCITDPCLTLAKTLNTVASVLYTRNELVPMISRIQFQVSSETSSEQGPPGYVTRLKLSDESLDCKLHLNLSYFSRAYHDRLNHDSNEQALAFTKQEILGVMHHEVTHIVQYNGQDTAYWGLIEGIADFVRMVCGYSPPHWRRNRDLSKRWDCGYSDTAHFLHWLAVEKCEFEVVRKLNDRLRLRVVNEEDEDEDEEDLLESIFETCAVDLWKEYCTFE